jgi:18S rRNA (guanine1575-N7)-methyltransferase
MAVPELSGPAELYYNEKESESYTKNTRITKIQAEITQRAIDLLEINMENPIILDLGCGSGLSGQTISENGYEWVGMDISPSMLKIASSSTKNIGLLESDIGVPLPFRENSFDYIISISAVQWLFQSYKKEHHPYQRIKVFFKSIYSVVVKKAVIQFYCNKKEIEILKNEAKRAGFSGGLTIDNEGTKNSKYFLVLSKDYLAPKKEKKLEKSKSRKAKVE